MMIASDIHEQLITASCWQDVAIPSTKALAKTLQSRLKIKNTIGLYKDFYKSLARNELLVRPDQKTLEWADVYPFLYLHAAFEGVAKNHFIKHLVIDEMQDYTPIQYAVLNQLFPCPKTILGDFSQAIHPSHQNTPDELRQLYPQAQWIELNTSYRSTYEIMRFAQQIQPEVRLNPINRHGTEPLVVPMKSEQAVLAYLSAFITDFTRGPYASLGILTKSAQRAYQLFEQLQKNHTVELISQESCEFTHGVSITATMMSKGLEFDTVIIADASQECYHTPFDRRLLYVACTRAMHQLILLYTEEKCSFLP